jgi:hypothetical protein
MGLFQGSRPTRTVVSCRISLHSQTRRAFLMAVVLAPALRLRGRAQPERLTPSLDDFVRLSQSLVGRTNLDREVAAIYHQALMADGATGPVLERRIIECWYTGTYPVAGGRRVATHTGALMWAALGMPAPGTCSGRFGAWAARPPAVG